MKHLGKVEKGLANPPETTFLFFYFLFFITATMFTLLEVHQELLQMVCSSEVVRRIPSAIADRLPQ